MIDTPKYLTVAECLERLPLRVSEREFRREVRVERDEWRGGEQKEPNENKKRGVRSV